MRCRCVNGEEKLAENSLIGCHSATGQLTERRPYHHDRIVSAKSTLHTPMKKRILLALIALSFCSSAIASDQNDYPRVAFHGPGGGGAPVDRDQYVMLVLEGPAISHDSTIVPDANVVALVNSLLESKGVSNVAVFVREGTKYGDVIRGVDILRGTKAKNIGVGMKELPHGKNP